VFVVPRCHVCCCVQKSSSLCVKTFSLYVWFVSIILTSLVPHVSHILNRFMISWIISIWIESNCSDSYHYFRLVLVFACLKWFTISWTVSTIIWVQLIRFINRLIRINLHYSDFLILVVWIDLDIVWFDSFSCFWPKFCTLISLLYIVISSHFPNHWKIYNYSL